MNKTQWTHENSVTMGAALWSVKQTRTAPNTVCPLTQKEIDRGRAWCVFHGYDAIHESAESEANELIQVAVSELNRRGITDMDDAQVGLTLPVYMVNTSCPMTKGFLAISKRDIDAAVGLRQGERCHGISLEALHSLSPTIERYLSERFGTPIYEPPATPQPSAEEVAAIERNALKYSIAALAARELFAKVPSAAEVGRVIKLFEAVREYHAA